MAGKPRYTVAQVVEALQSTQGLQYLAAKKLGCHPDTITNYSKRYKQVAGAISAARGELVDIGEVKLRAAVMAGDAWAVCFLLKTQGKDRGYSERTEQHHTGGMTHEHRLSKSDRDAAINNILAELGRRGLSPNHGQEGAADGPLPGGPG